MSSGGNWISWSFRLCANGSGCAALTRASLMPGCGEYLVVYLAKIGGRVSFLLADAPVLRSDGDLFHSGMCICEDSRPNDDHRN